MKSCLKKFLVFGLWFLVLSNTIAYAEVVSVKDLINEPDRFNGKIVEVKAEAIGELLIDRASNGAWLNLAADDYNISVFSSDRADFSKIKAWGQYGQIGDQVMVRGVFKQSCPGIR